MPIVAGFDVGGTNARLTVFDAQSLAPIGEVRRQRIRGVQDPGALADIMAKMLDEASADQDVQAVGVGLAAQLNKGGTRVVNAPNLGWRDVDFASMLQQEEAFRSVAPRVVNDLNALAWGERVGGAIQGVDDVLAVYVGTGVGGALICDGQLVEGHGGKAGEIGHVKVVVGGRFCGCGEKGCVEAYAGGVHLEQQTAALLQEHPELSLEREGKLDLLLADEASANHEALGELWNRVTDYLAISIANAVTLTNPRALLLGGGILENLPRFQELTLRKVTPLVLAAAREDLEVRFGALGDNAGMLGAAWLAKEGQ